MVRSAGRGGRRSGTEDAPRCPHVVADSRRGAPVHPTSIHPPPAVSKPPIDRSLVAAADERVAVGAPAIGVQGWGWAIRNDSWQARLASIPLVGPAAAADMGKGAPDSDVVAALWRKLLPGVFGKGHRLSSCLGAAGLRRALAAFAASGAAWQPRPLSAVRGRGPKQPLAERRGTATFHPARSPDNRGPKSANLTHHPSLQASWTITICP